MKRVMVFIGLCLLVSGSLFAAPERAKIVSIDTSDYIGHRFTVLSVSKDGKNIDAFFYISSTYGDYMGRNMGALMTMNARVGQEIVYDMSRATDEYVSFYDDDERMYDFSLITVLSWNGIPIRM